MSRPDRLPVDRLRGAIVGLAVGDALGGAVEFMAPGSFSPLTDMIGGGPHRLAPGEWTDDTSMALCLAESLVDCGGFDARDQMQRYVRWWRDGHLSAKGRCFDIGTLTAAALGRFGATGEPYAGSTDLHAAGNGSLMRLAPVPIFFARDPELALERCADSSRTTHAAPAAVDACVYFGGLLLGAFRGASKDEILAPQYTPVGEYWERHRLAPEVAEIASGSYHRKSPPAIRGGGYVVESLEAALWAFATTSDFRSGCLAAANLGDDADTTAAVYGQLAGAYYGEEAIPADWRGRLAMWPTIDRLATALSHGPPAQTRSSSSIPPPRRDG